MGSFKRGLLVGLLVALLPATVLASTIMPVSVAVAQHALQYASPAADNTETFYESVADTKVNATTASAQVHQVQLVLNAAGYHGRDDEIAEIQRSLTQAASLAQQAHDVGQHADNLTQALVRDLKATAGTPTP